MDERTTYLTDALHRARARAAVADDALCEAAVEYAKHPSSVTKAALKAKAKACTNANHEVGRAEKHMREGK